MDRNVSEDRKKEALRKMNLLAQRALDFYPLNYDDRFLLRQFHRQMRLEGCRISLDKEDVVEVVVKVPDEVKQLSEWQMQTFLSCLDECVWDQIVGGPFTADDGEFVELDFWWYDNDGEEYPGSFIQMANVVVVDWDGQVLGKSRTF